MLERLASIILIGALALVVYSRPALAQTQDEQIQKINKVKEQVIVLGTGKEAKVEVTLNDGRKFKGHIGEFADEHFVVVDAKTGKLIPVKYSEVEKLKGTNGLTAKKVAINIGKGAAIVAGVAAALTIMMLIFLPKT
jgi:hypothetical protein